MQLRRFLPVLLTFCAVATFVIAELNFSSPQEVASDDYIVKETTRQDLMYVEPRFSNSIDLAHSSYFKEFDLQSLGSFTENLAEKYNIVGTQFHTRTVDGNSVPGLFLFLGE